MLSASADSISWSASDAFEAAGIIESYLPADGREWIVNENITLTFRQNDGNNAPQMLLNPQPAMFISAGNTLELTIADGLEIREVELQSTDEFPLTDEYDTTALPSGSYTLTLLAGRAAISNIEITFDETNAITETEVATNTSNSCYDLLGRKLTAPPHRGIYIINGTLLIK